MIDIRDGLGEAIRLLLAGDADIWQVIWLSLRVSLTATFAALALGIPLGSVLALARFPGRPLAVGAVNAGMGLPPIVAGLVISLLFFRNGPFGALHLLYTPAAMIVAQAVIALPVVAGLTYAALTGLDPRYRLLLRSLGASPPIAAWWLLRQARAPVLAAVIAGFGAVISEVGAAMMVGGNIKGQTRVLTTATVLEAGRGNYDVAMALSFVLLGLTYGVVLALTLLQGRGVARPEM
jgi:tungstate transport system permease protein